MGREQGSLNSRSDFVAADHLDTEFGDAFLTPLRTQKGIAAVKRTELALAENLPAAAVVILVLSGSGGEERVFDDFEVGLGDIDG